MFPSRPSSPKPSISFVRSKSAHISLMLQETFIHDVKAKLICELQDDGQWRLFLTSIMGRKVNYLLGRDYGPEERLFIDKLLPIRIREMHQKKVNDILSDGNQSPYWSALFTNMLGRRIKICNPINDEPRFIKIIMNSKESQNSNYEFSVICIDETAQHLISKEQIENAHDVRSLMRMGIKTISEHPFTQLSKEIFLRQTPQQLAEIYEQLKERDAQLLDVMEMSMSIYGKVNHQKLESERLSSIELMMIDHKINEFLEEQAQEKSITIKPIGDSSLMLPFNLINLLRLMLNQMIQLCLQQQITQIYIQHRCDTTLYICDLYVTQTLTYIEKCLDPYIKEWIGKGGNVEYLPNHNLLISMPAFSKFGFYNEDEPIVEISKIIDEIKMKSDIPVIYLVDDVFLNIKVLINYCIRFMKSHEKVDANQLQRMSCNVPQNEWQNRKVISVNCGGAIFICCANGDVASKVLREVPAYGMITDMEMPGSKDGESLILWLKAHEIRNRLEPMKILVNTALTIDEYQKKHVRLNQIGVPYVCKGIETTPIQWFVKETLDLFYASQLREYSVKIVK
jgi:hypothetical protein